MTTKKSFSLRSAIQFAVQSFIPNASTWLILAATWLGIYLLFGFIQAYTYSFWIDPALANSYITNLFFSRQFITVLPQGIPGTLQGFWMFFTIFCLSLLSTYQFIRFAFGVYNNKPLSLRELCSIDRKTFFPYVGALALAFIKISLGCILLLIPGLYYMGRYYFAGFSILDGTTDSIQQDMKRITQLTYQVRIKLICIIFLWVAYFALLQFIGTRAFAMLFLPLFWLINVHIYEQLKTDQAALDQAAPQQPEAS